MRFGSSNGAVIGCLCVCLLSCKSTSDSGSNAGMDAGANESTGGTGGSAGNEAGDNTSTGGSGNAAGPPHIVAISAGNGITCGLSDVGALWCWGGNSEGMVGDGTTINRSRPVPVSGLDHGVTAVSVGLRATCAIVEGAAKCWGGNLVGDLGDGTHDQSSVPRQVVGLTSGVTVLVSSMATGCAVANGALSCWGAQLQAYATNSSQNINSPVPVTVDGAPSNVSALWPGSNGMCLSTSDGGFYCWGVNYSGQLGIGLAPSYPTQNGAPTPTRVNELSNVTGAFLASGYALATAGGVWYSWGEANSPSGQMGTCTTDIPECCDGAARHLCSTVPLPMPSAPSDVVASSGKCAVTAAGAVWCYGKPFASASAVISAMPVQIIASGATAVANLADHACALTDDGVVCWGSNSVGQLGDGTTTDSVTPVRVAF